jgi:hypothetical protein
VLALITEANEVEAERTVALVFELTDAVPAVIAEAIEDEAELVFALTEAVSAVIAAASEVEAVVKFVSVASEPVSSVPSERRRVAYVQTSEAVREEPLVSVLVPFVQTSAARVPNVVRDLVVADQTAVGIVEASEVEAVKTVELVLLLIVVIAEESWEFVLAFTSVVTLAIPAANEVEAARIEAFVFAFTSVVTLAVPSASEVEALRIVDAVEAVPAVIADAIEEEAVVTSDVFASVPTVSVASVRLRVA